MFHTQYMLFGRLSVLKCLGKYAAKPVRKWLWLYIPIHVCNDAGTNCMMIISVYFSGADEEGSGGRWIAYEYSYIETNHDWPSFMNGIRTVVISQWKIVRIKMHIHLQLWYTCIMTCARTAVKNHPASLKTCIHTWNRYQAWNFTEATEAFWYSNGSALFSGKVAYALQEWNSRHFI